MASLAGANRYSPVFYVSYQSCSTSRNSEYRPQWHLQPRYLARNLEFQEKSVCHPRHDPAFRKQHVAQNLRLQLGLAAGVQLTFHPWL